MESIIPRAIAHSVRLDARYGRQNANMASCYFHSWISRVAASGTRILAELVMYGRLRIRKVAAPEGRLLEAFQSCGGEHGVSAHNGGLAGSSFAAFRRRPGWDGKGWDY